MTDETTLMNETEIPIPFKVADGAGIEKGAILRLTESMTAIINSGAGQKIAGILQAEKIANDGVTMASVYMGGIFKGVAAASIAIGVPIQISATENRLETASSASGASIIGYALEAPSRAGQTFMFVLKPGLGGEK